MWRALFDRQAKVLSGRACDEFTSGLNRLNLVSDRIPDFDRLSDSLEKLTGWRVVPVPSLVACAALLSRFRTTWLICEGAHETSGILPNSLRTTRFCSCA